jgi:hypothetical protein
MAVALFTVFFVGGAFATVTGSPSNFESLDALNNATPPLHDGNMTVDTANSADWNCFANGKSTGFTASGTTVSTGSGSCNSNIDYSAALAKTDLAATTSDDSWVNGTKMDTACAPVGTNKNPPKDDFTNIASYSEQDSSKHTFLYGATIRVAPNGNASENVELNQVAGTTACPITRTFGDHLLAFDYLNGGGTLNLHVLTWIDNSVPGTSNIAGGNNGTCIIKTDSMPCWGANVITPNSTTFEGDVNQSAITAAKNGISGQALVAGEFAEFGVNLTTALGQNTNTCNTTSQIDWESRSSGSSFSSNPEDLAIEHKSVSNCGRIIIRKVTAPNPDPNDSSFSYSDNIASSSDTFSLKNGESKDFGSSILAGSYNVNETPDSGYTLSNIDCSASSTGNGSSVTYGTSDGSFQAADTKVNINLKPGDTIDCTYTNTLNSATLTTQQGTATGTVFPGTSVTDTATVTGSTSTYPDSSVPVKFFLCGPVTGLTGCASGDSTRIPVTPDGTLSSTATNGKSTATSAAVNTSGKPLAAGTYCFGATWAGDATYPGALSDDGTNECFTVSQIGTTTTTTPSPTGGTTTYGDKTVTDHAVVEAVADGGGIPTGTVTFTICSPSQMTALTESTCATGGTQVGSAVTLGSVDGGLLHPSASADSSAFTNGGSGVNQVGTWCWRAVYSPSGTNGNNYTGSHDSSVGECFTVTDTTNSSSTQIWYPNDSGSVSAAGAENISGTLTLQLYTGGTCQAGNEVSGQSYTSGDQTNKATITVASKTAGVPQTSYGVSTNATVSWKVVFTSDNTALIGNSSHCESSSIANLQN